MKRKIMAAAWEMYHAGEIKTKAQFSICLRVAWAEAKAAEAEARAAEEAAARAAELESMSAAEQLAAMSGEAVLELLTIAVRAMAKKARAEGVPQKSWPITVEDVETVAAEAYCDICAMLEREEYSGKPLFLVSYIAAGRAAQRIYRAERKHANAIRYEATEVDGGRTAAIDIYATAAGEPMPSPESAMMIADEVERALKGSSAEERKTAYMIGAGYTVREIAAKTGRSKSAVARDMERIRARARAAAAA